jgi:hypothetical protein
MSDQVLLRDLVAIPDEVHAGDFVLSLAKGVKEKSTITDYVVTPPLAGNFDRALSLIRSAVETGSSRAAYLDGSFGSGKSHFMAMLHAILSNNPDARGKNGLADVVAKHDAWLKGRRFLLVPYHLPDSQSLDAAILGGYVSHVTQTHPGKPLPAVFRDDELIADARELRERAGDEEFIAQLPAGDDEWGNSDWDTASLNQAFAEPPHGPERRRLVGDLLVGPFKRYARAVRADQESYISLDEGLSVISKHAKDVLGYDAIVLLLDELVLWLAGYIGDTTKISAEAQKVSKLVESAEHERPAPIVSFVPRQRDLRDLVRKEAYGAETTTLFDTLKYWDGRFDSIRLDDNNLPAIVHERLLKAKDENARRSLDEAFAKSTTVPAQTWEILLGTHGDKGDKDAFRLTYPFSPAFVHTMVDISGALQRERTALKLMQQLLVDYRDVLPVGQLMPLGAIFDVLASGADRPFTDKLRDEFEQAKRFYTDKLRPYLLMKHGLTADQVPGLGPRHLFRADDLVAKTLLLAALVPNVPALGGLTATRLAALNHGSIVTMLPNQERGQVARTLKQLSAQFGEIRLSGSEDDPRVDLALIGVDTEGIIRDNRHADDDAARRRLVRELLWEELKLKDEGAFDVKTTVVWRGTGRAVDVLMGNVRDEERMPSTRFQADPGTIKMVIDYPFDVGNFGPAEDVLRVHQVQDQVVDTDTLIWLPHFLSDERKADLSALIVINYILERDRLTEVTPTWTADDRHHARTQLDSRRSALNARLREALRRAYGVSSHDGADLGPLAHEPVMTLVRGLEPRMLAGQGLRSAFERLCFQLLDYRYPLHPDFDPNGRGHDLRPAELDTVVAAVDKAAQDKVGRYEVPRGDVATLKKIANPLKLGVMHEQAFVLGHAWPELLNKKSAGAPEVSVGQLRGWIEEDQPGLPVSVQNLVVVCYSIQADKEWLRGGQPIPMPAVARVTDDMRLRGTELPTEAEFETASRRAEGIFGISREPVRTTRSVQALAAQLRRNASGLVPAAESLAGELARHAKTLGLEDAEQPRARTARLVAPLLARLAASADPTQVVRVLAEAELPRENAIYQAHLTSAELLTRVLRDRNWQVLDDLATRATTSDDPQAEAIITALRRAAGRDEHETSLTDPLRKADREALELMMARTRTAPPAPPIPVSAPPFTQAGVSIPSWKSPGREIPVDPAPTTIPAREVAAAVEKIRAAAEANPDAEFEITWRIVTR